MHEFVKTPDRKILDGLNTALDLTMSRNANTNTKGTMRVIILFLTGSNREEEQSVVVKRV